MFMEEIPITPTTDKSPMSYELDIAPGMKATVEIDQEAVQASPSRMVPLGQILAEYAGSSARKYKQKSTLPKSLYRKALIIGIILGILSSCAVAVFLTVGS